MGRGSRCKECCCQSPSAILSILVMCSLVCTILAGVILQNGFTTTPTKQELFVGSLVIGVVVFSSTGLVAGCVFLLISCWRDRLKRRQNKNMIGKGIVKALDPISDEEEEEEEGRIDFDDVSEDPNHW